LKVADPQGDKAEARKQRAKDLRKRIKAFEAGEAPPSNRPVSPREFTDRAAQAEYERAKEKKARTSRLRKRTDRKPD
jgi:hypothetical protein